METLPSATYLQKRAKGLRWDWVSPDRVDPRGILQDMTKGDGFTTYVHTEDNQVEYFSTKRDPERKMKLFNQLS